MAEVVSDTSPLLYLHRLGILSLLRRLVGRVLIPPAVRDELEAGYRLGIDVPLITELNWIEVRQPQGRHIVMLARDLGRGEEEAMLLAIETPASIILLDDGLARRTAEALKLRFTGTLGLLIDAKRAGLLTEVRPVVDRLQAVGFRLSTPTRDVLLRLAGEGSG